MLWVKKNIFRIKAKNGENVKFVPNKSQKRINEIIENHEKNGTKTRLIIIKGRQVGGTANIQRVGASYAMTRPNFAFYTVAHDGESVRQIFQNHIKYSFDELPEVLREMYKVDRNNANQLKFENRECFNSSITVGQSARSNTIDFLHVSEVAKIAKDKGKWQELITGSFEAANAGHIILETTAGGFDPFYDFVMEQKNDPNSQWQILFLGWFDSDEYRIKAPTNVDWKQEYLECAKKYKLQANAQDKYNLDDDQMYFYLSKIKTLKEQVKAEYPLCFNEAFVSSSDSFFRIEDIFRLEENAKDYTLYTGVKIFSPVEKGKIYSIGVDTATGLGNDNATISVLDIHTMQQVAAIKEKLTPLETAVTAALLGHYYNSALITPEINNESGGATMSELRMLYDEDNIYKRYKTDETSRKNKKIPMLGFGTTSKTRPVMIYELRQLIEDEEIEINDTDCLTEMKTFVRKKNGRIEHEQGYHDDCIFAVMLANEGRKYILDYL